MDSQLKPNKLHNDPAFVLGNGKSRQNLDLNCIKPLGKTYGCNALYREFEPDYLIAVDVKMVNEIISAGYHKDHQVWTNPNKGVSTKTNINFFSPHKGWSSGPTALWFAATQGHKNIYIFGFDYQGINGKFNNIYADTFNYKKSTDSATYHGNWLSQTEKVIKEFRSTQFFRIVEDSGFLPDRLGPQLQNLKTIRYQDLEQIFPGSIYKNENVQKTTI